MKKKKKLNLFIIYFFTFLYMEILFKILIKSRIFSISIIHLILFLIAFSIFCYLISKCFNERVNKIIYFVLVSLLGIWFAAQYVVKDYFGFYISLTTLGIADQVGSFLEKAFIETFKRILGIILLFVPVIITFIIKKKINFHQIKLSKIFGYFIGMLLIHGIFLLSLFINKEALYSPYVLYYNINDVSLNMENFGILNTLCIDTKRVIFGFDEKVVIKVKKKHNKKPKEKEIVYTYNNLDIDFNSLFENEKNNNVKKIHEYMKGQTGTLKNKYTGMFKGKNLILFMAESFNEIAVNKNLTPTFDKLIHDGFYFENYYTPTIFSTIGGEFQELSGLYAHSVPVLKEFRNGNISFPQGIGNEFKKLNYDLFAYHNNSYTFQDRNKYLKSMGIDHFVGCGNGMEKLINCKVWPQSDVEMIDATVSDYIDSKHFMVFYASVSGHADYTFARNAQARKHREEVMNENLPYSERPSAYIAAEMELDRALELLIQKLAEKDRLKDTVIALVGDHHPYELTIDEINEVSSYKKDDVVTVCKSNFMLWNSEMKPIKIKKVGSQIDVIPTIYNLFGIDYDSRLFIGRDILSDGEGLAMFGNRSWVTDKGTYFTRNGKFVPSTDEILDKDYVINKNIEVNNKINMSKMIIDNNYYAKVFK